MLGVCVERDGGSAGGGGTGGGTAMGGGMGGGGGTAGSGGGSGVGGGGGGTGGGAPMLQGLIFRAPDAGLRTSATMLPIIVDAVPTNAPAGTVSVHAVRRDGGAPITGMLGTTGGNVFTGNLMGLGHGSWRLTAFSGAIDASVDFEVDTVGPALTVELPPVPDYGVNTADFLPEEGDGGAYRKDEVIQVRVTSPDLDFATGQLTARWGTGQPLAIATSTNCGTSTVACRAFDVDLSRVEMLALTGDIVFTATGADDLGTPHRSATAATARVTRWQWARRVDATRAVRSVPAIGTGGRIFVGSGIGGGSPSGALIAVDADGGVPWMPISDAPIVGPVAVGRGAMAEHVFYQPATAASSGTLKSVVASTGMPDSQTCAGSSTIGSANEGGLALFNENAATVAAIGVQSESMTNNRGRVLVVEPGLCRETVASPLQRVQAPANVVTTSSTASLVGSDGNLRVFDYNGSLLTLRLVDESVGGVGTVNGLAMLSSTRVAGGGGGGPGIGRLFAFDFGATAASNAWDAGTSLSTPTSGPVVGQAGVYGVIRSGSNARLIRLASATGAESARTALLVGSSFSGSSIGSPVLGNNGKTYVVDENGALFVLPTNFAPDAGADWSAVLPTPVAGAVTASPTLDCNRRRPASETGVLYIATETGWLVSYLVDSPNGLDTTAPWPKYARDSRNTGNYNGPAIGCP